MRETAPREGNVSVLILPPLVILSLLLSGVVVENDSGIFADVNDYLNISENLTLDGLGNATNGTDGVNATDGANWTNGTDSGDLGEFVDVDEFLQTIEIVNVTMDVFIEDYTVESRGDYFITVASEGSRSDVAKDAFERLSANETVRLIIEDEGRYSVVETDKRELGKLIREGADRIYVDAPVSISYVNEPTEGISIENSLKICLLDTGAGEEDGNGHGTHIAEMITTIVPNAEIISVKVLDENGVGYSSGMINGIEECTEAGVDAIAIFAGGGRFGQGCDYDPVAEAAGNAVENGIKVIAYSDPLADYLQSPACGSSLVVIGSMEEFAKALWGEEGIAVNETNTSIVEEKPPWAGKNKSVTIDIFDHSGKKQKSKISFRRDGKEFSFNNSRMAEIAEGT
ncbi:hypothetical protein H0O02_00400, partial [Candidatus Micrarchaeota archaeon]|nr:hypothetical protein [Candidatus Micrarchaeota archaeon]